MPVLGSSNLVANKDMMSKIWTNEECVGLALDRAKELMISDKYMYPLKTKPFECQYLVHTIGKGGLVASSICVIRIR